MVTAPGPEPEDDDLAALVDQEFVAIARRVRLAADEELAEIEWETERAEIKRQNLTARSLEAMMEGERWQITIGPRVVDAIVVHVGQDFTGFQDRQGNLHDVRHVALGMIRVTGRNPRQGRAPTTLRPATFVARLLGLEQLRQVELASSDGSWSVTGVLDSVNSDHVIVHERSGDTAIVPLDGIGYLRRVVEERRRPLTPPRPPDR
jgi:hypothetical protein